jgi:hypothetical protein
MINYFSQCKSLRAMWALFCLSFLLNRLFKMTLRMLYQFIYISKQISTELTSLRCVFLLFSLLLNAELINISL